MISTKPKEEPVDKVTQIFELYINLNQEERSKFLDKSTSWLIRKIEQDRINREKDNK